MSPRVYSISNELWSEAADRLEDRVARLKSMLKCGTAVKPGDGPKMAPCTSLQWQRDVGTEHDEYTCYFKHWFKKVDGVLQCCKFSHLALMPLVRSCVWQALLAEFISGKTCGRDAVRLRVEDELDHYSNLTDVSTRQKIGLLAQDWFGTVKNHLNAYDKPLTRSGLGGAEKMTINMPGLDYRSRRKGWSNRNLRKCIAQRLVDCGIADLPTRKEQEAFIWKFMSEDESLKQSAPKAVLRLLSNYYDADTGEVVLKPWSREELAEIRREAREKSTFEHVSARVELICSKISRGEKLTAAEIKFRSVHKQLFSGMPKPARKKGHACCTELNITEEVAIRKRKHKLQIGICPVMLSRQRKGIDKMENPKITNIFPNETYGVLVQSRKEGT